jgi:UDP-N-acetylglucosamine 2-epimerase (non-hydrolysing)
MTEIRPPPTSRAALTLVPVDRQARRRGARTAPKERQTVVHAVSTRADCVGLAPLILALEQRDVFRQVVIRTAVHGRCDDVLAELGVAAGRRFVDAGRGTPAQRTARMLPAFEQLMLQERAALAVVAGDGDAALACALAAAKAGVLVARLGAGLRTWDWSAPDEINRVLTDRVSDTLFTDCAQAEDNLREEGIVAARIHAVGNTMVDAVRRWQPPAKARAAWRLLGLREGGYVLVLLHALRELDDSARRAALFNAIAAMRRNGPVVVPLVEANRRAGRLPAADVLALEAPGFLDLLSLELGAGAIVTDAGSVQEEASALGIPCFTLREATECAVTLTHGTNVLLGGDPAALEAVELRRRPAIPAAIPLWDGHAAARAADVLVANYALWQ